MAPALSPSRIALTVLAMLALFVAGWLAATHRRWTNGPDQPGALVHFEQITLKRGPCFGSCPVYEVTVERSGRVTYQTSHYAGSAAPGDDRKEEVRHTRMPAAALAALIGAVESEAYARLRPDYSAEVTDMPATILEASGAGDTRRTLVYAVPCRSEPGGTPWDYDEPVPDVFCSVTGLIDIASCARYWSADSSPWPPAGSSKPVSWPPRCGARP
jgi:hypothetical protein